jgi:geranylgeranyl pyrophosphate synthase
VLGDAGGFANLIHGGGIFQARKSATIAAPFCRQFLQTGRESFLADYDRAARQHFNDYEITWDKRIRNVLWNQQALEAVINRATTDTELSKSIGILLTSTESHESVYKRLEEEMLDVIYTELADRAEPYRTAINERLATLFTSPTPLHEYANETLLNNDSKRLRAYIVVLAAELFGARRRNVIDFSSIYEIFHTASLIHDDIMDDSHRRRGRKPLHVKYGVDNAIVTGDLLLIKGYTLIAQFSRSEDISREQLLAMLEVIGESGERCCLGQSLDLRMARERQYDDIEAYLNMITLKTGSLIAGATKFGAVLAGASTQQVATIERFGTHLGVAFQIVDDSLDLLGQQRAKKSLQSDLKEGKATPMLIRAFARASRAERESILQTVGDRNIDQAAVQRILKLYRRYDAIDYAQQLSHEYIQRARADLETLPNRDAKARFGEIVNALDYWSLLSDTEYDQTATQ